MVNKNLYSTRSYFKRWPSKIKNSGEDRSINPEEIKFEKHNTSWKTKAWLVGTSLVIAIGLGYGLSFLVLDDDIRTNTININTSGKIFYSGETQPSTITRQMERAYTAKEIEENYVYKWDGMNLPGVSADKSNIPSVPSITNQYITNEERDKNYFDLAPLTVDHLYKASSIMGGSVNLDDVTEEHFSKRNYKTDTLYKGVGTGASLSLNEVDPNSLLLKSSFVGEDLYLASGSGSALSFSEVTNQYWSKESFTGNNRIFQVTRNADNVLLRNDVTNKYIKKSTLTSNTLYLATGTGDDLSLAPPTNFILSNSIDTDNYIYVGNEEEDPSSLKIPKVANTLSKKIKFRHPSVASNINYARSGPQDLFTLINLGLQDGYKITQEEFTEIIQGMTTNKYKLTLFVGSCNYANMNDTFIARGWGTNTALPTVDNREQTTRIYYSTRVTGNVKITKNGSSYTFEYEGIRGACIRALAANEVA